MFVFYDPLPSFPYLFEFKCLFAVLTKSQYFLSQRWNTQSESRKANLCRVFLPFFIRTRRMPGWVESRKDVWFKELKEWMFWRTSDLSSCESFFIHQNPNGFNKESFDLRFECRRVDHMSKRSSSSGFCVHHHFRVVTQSPMKGILRKASPTEIPFKFIIFERGGDVNWCFSLTRFTSASKLSQINDDENAPPIMMIYLEFSTHSTFNLRTLTFRITMLFRERRIHSQLNRNLSSCESW